MCTYFFQIIHEIFDDFKLSEFLLHKVILLKATSQAMFNRKQETKISYFLMKLKELRPIRKRKKKKDISGCCYSDYTFLLFLHTLHISSTIKFQNVVGKL